MEKCFHFRGQWKNGDKLTICSYGKDKKDAFIKMMKARKQKKFKYNKGDNFSMTTTTNEEIYTKLRRAGIDKSRANILSLYGHTTYIVKDNKVEIN